MRLVVRGEVQGVSYRAWAVARARALGLGGWVRNRSDGSVEMLIAGDPASVEAMTSACRAGPAAARVRAVDAAPAEGPAPFPFAQRPTL